MSQGPFLRKYGVQTTIDFTLYETDGVDFKVDATHASGDTKIMKDEGAEANTSNSFTDEGTGYSIVLTATEMQAARVKVYIADQGTKTWLDTDFIVETYGNASAMHAVDLDDAVRAGLTALPNAAADAAGGLAISDAGGLDLDSKLANTNEVTAARMGALTDWINGGRLDLLLDAIKAVTDALPNSGALTDIDTGVNNLEARLTAARGGYLDNLNISENVAGTSEISGLNDPTAATIADAVWDEAQAGHVGAGSFGLIASEIADILADTNELQGDWTNGGRLDVILDAILDDTDLIDDAGSGLTKIATDVAAILVDTNELQSDWTNTGRLDTILDSILADTNELQTDDVPGLIAALNDIAVTDILADSTAFNGAELNPATSGKMAYYVAKMAIALINKAVITEASGAVEQFNDSNVSVGTIAGALSSDGTYTTRLRLVQ